MARRTSRCVPISARGPAESGLSGCPFLCYPDCHRTHLQGGIPRMTLMMYILIGVIVVAALFFIIKGKK